MKKRPEGDDTNSREYWRSVVDDPAKHGFSDRQVLAMRHSLDLTDPMYWKKVLAKPKGHSFSRKRAMDLEDHFLKSRSERFPSTPLEEIEGEAGLHMGFYGEKFVRTWLEVPVVSPRNAALLLHSENPSRYKSELPDLGDAFDLMMVRFEGIAHDGGDRNLLDWISVAREHELTGVAITGWSACGTVLRTTSTAAGPGTAEGVSTDRCGAVASRPQVDNQHIRRPNKTDKTKVFEAEVLSLMSKSWDNRVAGTSPTKQELHTLVYEEMLRGPIKTPSGKPLNIGMVRDAAKPWKQPQVLPAFVPVAKYGEKRHPFKRDK